MADPLPEYESLDATGLARVIADGELTAAEVVEAAIARIEALDGALNAVVRRDFERARESAGRPVGDGPFAGVPFLLKDLVVEEGELVTFGSTFFRDYRAETTHELVHRFRRAGLISLGRTNTPEFGLLPTTEPQLHGATRNPWNPSFSAGGSSGGAAAAVAAGMVPMAHASDGGGSIRIPASACGVFGLKPSRGRMPQRPRSSNDGLVAPLGVSRTVRDSAALLDATAGPLPGDLWWAPSPQGTFLEAARTEPDRLRCAFTVHDFSGQPVAPEVADAIRHSVALLESLGHDVAEARPAINADAMAEAFLTVWASFADTVFRLILQEVDKRTVGRMLRKVLSDRMTMRLVTRLDQRKAGATSFEPFTWKMAQRSWKSTPGHLALAQASLQEVSYEMAAFFDRYDILVSPVLAAPPVALGEIDQEIGHDDLIEMLSTYVAFTPLANFAGLPAMSVPLWWTENQLPIGTQVIAPFAREDRLFSLAAQLEQAQPWADRRPAAFATRGQ